MGAEGGTFEGGVGGLGGGGEGSSPVISGGGVFSALMDAKVA
tara:strand:- start:187 stop:312 length:126 start_codon:yes stop_codon:yes gene_type:complete